MAEFKRNKTKDKSIWEKKRFDNHPIPTRTKDYIKKSIVDTRKVYSGMLDSEFANWYSRKYGVSHDLVWSVLVKGKEL